MAHAPYGIRLLIGAAVTIVEETRKLPQTILMSPMTLASQAAHIVMRVQQNVADLVIKGDEALDALFPPKDEQPEWATFDEDLSDETPAALSSESDRERLTEGRFALYSTGPDDADRAGKPGPNQAKQARQARQASQASQANQAQKPADPAEKPSRPATKRAGLATVDPPDIAIELDYDELTLAQLRARLQSLSVSDLDALLAYEGATKARAPFQTLLANRITRATAK